MQLFKTETKSGRSRSSRQLRRTADRLYNKLYYLCSFAATEIRCQEKSKGGLSYEVILAEPSVTTPLPLKRPSSGPTKPTSVENIEEKLKAAEERRLVSNSTVAAAAGGQ